MMDGLTGANIWRNGFGIKITGQLGLSLLVMSEASWEPESLVLVEGEP
jgi:hypothetical protein